MTISQRASVHDVMVDVVCTGRFYDFLEKRDDRWGLVLRQPIYEKDRMDPLDPAARLTLDAKLLASFPEGYRHLAYLQSQIGYTIKPDMPGLKGEAVQRLAGVEDRLGEAGHRLRSQAADLEIAAARHLEETVAVGAGRSA